MAAVRIMKKSQRSTAAQAGGEVSLSGNERRRPMPEASSDPQAHLSALEGEIALYRHALEKVREEMQAFAYSVSHDLRAPIRAIEGFSKILLDDYAAELQPDAKKFLTLITQNTQQLSSQIEDLLKYYRLGKLTPQKGVVESESLVREALADQSMSLPAGITISSNCVGKVLADPVQLRHAICQLLSNAIKFSRNAPNPQIEIGSRCDPNSTTIFVKDNGVGFEMQYAVRLFSVFQKLHSSEEYPGNGIGLAIVKRIVEAHGGCVWAEAEPDRGATFFFTLPGGAVPARETESVLAENSQKTA